MSTWYANPVLQEGGEYKAHDMTTFVITGSEIQYWTGSAWVLKSLKDWIASEWERKICYRWNGSAWVAI